MPDCGAFVCMYVRELNAQYLLAIRTDRRPSTGQVDGFSKLHIREYAKAARI